MPHEIYRRGKIWHYRGTVAGRRLRGSTRTAEKATAERIAAEVEAQEWRRHLDGPGAGLTMAHVFLNYRNAGKPTRFLVPLEDHFKNTAVPGVTGETIRQVARKIYPGAKGATWNRQVIVPTQAAINHSAELGLCNVIKVKRFPVEPATKVPATTKWVKDFAAQAEADGLPHLAALAVFMFGTAARIGEACALTWASVSLSEASARIRVTKPTPWTRTAHLPPRVIAALANIPSNRNPTDLVFGYAGRGSVKDPWSNVIKRANLDRLTPHCCRHGFATTMLHKGYDVKTVAKLGGWKDAATVLRTYAHALEDRTVTDHLFDTNTTQGGAEETASIRKERGNQA